MKNMLKSAGAVFVLLLLILSSCDTDSSGRRKKEYLPAATGQFGQIILVMDSVAMKGAVGEAIEDVIESNYPVLPQPEPRFKVIHVTPKTFTASLLHQATIIRVYTSDNKSRGNALTKKAVPASIKNKLDNANPGDYMSVAKDVYARGQEVVFFYGKTQEELAGKIMVNAEVIQNYLNNRVKKRVIRDLYTKESKVEAFNITKKFGASMRVPFGYKKAEEAEDFLWFRNPGQKIDKNFFMASIPFTDESQLEPDAIVAWRDRLCKQHVLGSDDPNSYMETQKILKPESRVVDFNGKYAVEIRGLWRLHEIAMGGTYVGYAIVDEAQKKLFYIEGFLYRPGGNKREMMRELETILWTFRTSDQLPKGNTATKPQSK
ncbi:DUF4837 family protein [Persicobacter psychrovividus]|uniref:DUF4837 domain-containing protein n=1 Tax=Persicobacter psychrovividus TaxID=387638 RepID=A0ABM7VAM4_9BACT|nr:DUF4837 domain-containing protein [Persicobacter psychrovividus]